VLTAGLLNEGAKVVAVDVSEAALAALVNDLSHHDYVRERLLALGIDVSDSQACEASIDSALETFGTVDILINNAALGMGVVRADHMSNPVRTAELNPQIWDRVMRVNVSGAWYMSHFALPHMQAKGSGRIINVSTSFFTMLRAGFQPYGPAKAALEAMTASHAAEFAGSGITVNVVVPGGPADTPMVPNEAPYVRADLIAPTRMLAPIVWLCAEAGQEVTGQRFIAAQWDPEVDFDTAASASGAAAAWPELAQSPVWPGGKPD
jgi:NAD(P)-dependent dehydrogenase (short-subunit alcohol dehydrogenase family)